MPKIMKSIKLINVYESGENIPPVLLSTQNPPEKVVILQMNPAVGKPDSVLFYGDTATAMAWLAGFLIGENGCRVAAAKRNFTETEIAERAKEWKNANVWGL